MGKTLTAITGVVMIGVGIATGNISLIAQGVMTVAAVLLAPSMKARTANKNTLTIGETAREGIFGEGSTGGSLVDIFNYGGKYGTEWTVAIYALADHRCEALTGFYVQDKWVAFTGNGLVPGYKGQLRVHWLPGAWDDAVPDWVLANCPVVDGVPTWTANDRGRSVCKVYVAWKADKSDAKNPIWTSGSPYASFLWIVKGLRCYQARKDSSVGGSGAHRWDDPATREWTDNPIDCRYTWARGIYAGDQVDDPSMLLLGRGLSAVEQPPENVFAPANLCDEPVALKAGGTEPRYRIGGVFGGDDKYIDTDDDIASACGGYTVEREGAIEIVPGAAQPVVWDITDDDLVVGSTVNSSDFRTQTDDEWVNTVAAKYIEPEQQWKDHSAPVRRDTDDILADGEPKVAQPALTLCTSGTQAQRVAEMKRRMGRLWRTRGLTLPPRLVGVEHGDWIRWTSKRYGVRPIPTEPVAIIYRVESDAQDKGWQNQISLREINANVYGWTVADELDDESVAIDNPEPDFSEAPDAGDWTLTAELVTGDGLVSPALRITGAAGSDEVSAILFEYAAGPSAPDAEDDSAWITAGMSSGSATEMVITGIEAGTTYYAAVSYQIGAERSDRLVLGPVSVDYAIQPPTDLTIAAGTTSAALSWRNPVQAIFAYCNFYRGTTPLFADAVQIAGPIVGGLGQVQQITDSVGAGTYYWWGRAFDTSGGASVVAGPVTASVGAYDLTGGVVPSGASFTRASSGTRTNASGTLVTETTDAARFDYDRTTHALRGLLIEPAATNQIANSILAGGTVGTIGTGSGVVPTGIGVGGNGGLTRDVVALGSIDGIDYFTIRYHGTANTTGTITLALEPSATSAGTETWTASAYVALVAGSLSGVNTANMLIRVGGQPGTTLAGLTATPQRFAASATVAASTNITATLRWNYLSVGAAIDFTLLVGIPQRESGNKMTSPIRTSGAAATRAADVLAMNWGGRGVADGTITMRVTFDDNSTQDIIATVAGGNATLTTSLTRPTIRRIVKL